MELFITVTLCMDFTLLWVDGEEENFMRLLRGGGNSGEKLFLVFPYFLVKSLISYFWKEFSRYLLKNINNFFPKFPPPRLFISLDFPWLFADESLREMYSRKFFFFIATCFLISSLYFGIYELEKAIESVAGGWARGGERDWMTVVINYTRCRYTKWSAIESQSKDT